MELKKNNILNNLKNCLFDLKNSVKSTLGPAGKNVIISTKKEFKIVDDGITILKELEFTGKIENFLLELIRQASLRTDEIVGDGTTTTVLISCVLLEESIRLHLYGIKSIYLATGLKKILHFLIQKIRHLSKPLTTIDEIESILRNSVGNISEKMIHRLAKIYLRKSKDSLILLEEKECLNSKEIFEISEGIHFEQGFVSPYFLKDLNKDFIELLKPYILITDLTIENIEQIREILNYVKINRQPLLIVATNFSRSVLSTLIINNFNDNLMVAAVKAPYFDIKRKMVLQDLSFVTSSNFVDKKIYDKNYTFKVEDLGNAKLIKINKKETTVVLPNSSKLSLTKRLNQLNQDLKINDSTYEKEILLSRISLLSGGIVKFYFTAPTDSELCVLKHKLEDGINSLKTSFQEGICISSNSLYIHLIESCLNWCTLNLMNEEFYCFSLVKKALSFPFSQICQNVNLPREILLDKVLERGYPHGVNFRTNLVCNLKDQQIFDSSKMIRVILQNSFSVSTSLILTF